MMKRILYLVFSFFTLIFMTYTQSLAQEATIFLVENKAKFAGDYDQLKGLERTLREKLQHNQWSLSEEKNEYNIENLETVKNDLREKDGLKIGLFVGPYGIQAIHTLRETLGNSFIAIHLSHQKLVNHSSLIKNDNHPQGADYVILPSHVIDHEFKAQFNSTQTCLIETIGVCQNILPDQIREEYESLKDQIPHSSSNQAKYLVIVLGGDTQNADGKTWRYYQEEEAQKLAQYLIHLPQQHGFTLLVTNGPRTGKFDPQTGEERSTVHKNGVMDPVTHIFETTLKNAGLQAEKDYLIFDFQHGKPSAWKALLGCLATHPMEPTLLLEGGSTSMISQALANLTSQTEVVIYEHDAMTDVHKNHMNTEYETGRVGRLLQTLEGFPRKNKVRTSQPLQSAEDRAAEVIVNELTSKKS